MPNWQDNLVRAYLPARVLRDKETGQPQEIGASYIPASIARGKFLEQPTVVPKALFLCVEDLSGRHYSRASDRWRVRPASAEEANMLEISTGTPVIHLIHNAADENGDTLEVSESIWPFDRIVVVDDYDIAQEPEEQGACPMSDVIETPLPPSVRNHWWWRPGWAEGRHFYACHMALDDQAELRKLVADYQQALAAMPEIDLIPPQWLHLTMQGIAFVDEVSRSELVALGTALTAELATVDPPTVEFRYLTIQAEAVYLKAHPAEALYPLRSKMHDAALSVLGSDRFTEAVPEQAKFLPHVSIGYINRDENPEPIAAALRALTARPVRVMFTKADLLEFHRDHRMYEWTTATPIPIGG